MIACMPMQLTRTAGSLIISISVTNSLCWRQNKLMQGHDFSSWPRLGNAAPGVSGTNEDGGISQAILTRLPGRLSREAPLACMNWRWRTSSILVAPPTCQAKSSGSTLIETLFANIQIGSITVPGIRRIVSQNRHNHD